MKKMGKHFKRVDDEGAGGAVRWNFMFLGTTQYKMIKSVLWLGDFSFQGEKMLKHGALSGRILFECVSSLLKAHQGNGWCISLDASETA